MQGVRNVASSGSCNDQAGSFLHIEVRPAVEVFVFGNGRDLGPGKFYLVSTSSKCVCPAQLPEWLAFYAADEHIEYESLQWVLRISAATLDRALRSTKIKQGARKAQQESLSNLKESIEPVDSQ